MLSRPFGFALMLGKVKDAEQILAAKAGRPNTNSYEILFELGRLIIIEIPTDAARARNVWELALRRGDEQCNTD